MKQITVKKEILMAKLQENLKKHVEDYKEAMNGYKEQALKVLNEQLECIKNGELLDIGKLNFQTPRSYEKEYKKAIGMLEMSEETIITITAEEYDSYILDEWSWKDEWIFRNTQYLKKRL